jgi:iron complex outermembrane recepter protein
LFDFFTNGPNVADARYEIGDTTLKSERAKNLEGSIRWQSDRAHFEGTLFQNDVDRYIYNAPTSQTIGGLQVYRHQQTNARLKGGELGADLDVASPLTIRGSYDFVTGVDRVSGAPLPFIPPPRTIVGANLHSSAVGWAQRAAIGLEVESHAKQTRLAANDFAPKGYTLLNVDAEIERLVKGRPMRFDLDVRNALNTSYTDFLSRYKGFAAGPGINVILKASTGM